MKTNKDYQAVFKKKQEKAGLVQFHDWCHPDDKPHLRQVCKDLRNKHKREYHENVTDSTVTDVRHGTGQRGRSKITKDDPDLK